MLVYDLANPREMVGLARGTIIGLDQSQYVLSQWLPRQVDRTLEYRITNLTDSIEAATFRAFDTESAIGRRPGVTRVRGSLPPVSRKIPLTEWERLNLEAGFGQGASPPLTAAEQAFFDDATRMAAAVASRIEIARGQALYTGKVTIAEGGLTLEVDFGVPAEHLVAPGTLWSNVAASTIVEDLLAWIAVWSASNNGERPAAILTSLRVLGYMQRNAQVRELLASQAGTPAIVSLDSLNSVLGGYQIPPIITYEAQAKNSVGTTSRIIPDDRLLLLPRPNQGADGTPTTDIGPRDNGPVGETLFGVTAESLELQRNGFLTAEELPGVTAVTHFTSSPVTRWTEAVAVALPVLSRPTRVLVADVA